MFDTILTSTSVQQQRVAQLLKHYFYIAFLMEKPQDLPAGAAQMKTGLILNFTTYVLALLSFDGVGKSVLQAGVDIGCAALILYLALYWTGKLQRFEQAFGGLCGASAILNCVAIPLLLYSLPQTLNSAIEPTTLAQFSMFLLLVWSLSLFAHIVRHTFEIRMTTSILVSVGYYLFVSALIESLFSATVASDQVSFFQAFAVNWLHNA